MKKISIFLCFLCFLCVTTHAQSFKDLFLKMPQEVCPALSEYNRLEIVDNQKNDKTMQTRNFFRTFSTMKELTDDYAYLIVSPQSEKEFKMLTKHDGTRIIMVISTILCDNTPDSSVAFYTTDWKPLPTLDYYTLSNVDHFRKVTIDKDTNQLTVTSTNSPLLLQADGSGKDKEPFTLKYTLRWSSEKSQFILND